MIRSISEEEKKYLSDKYLGKRIKIISSQETRIIGKEGVVDHIDDIGQIHGSWGCAVSLHYGDVFEIVPDKTEIEKVAEDEYIPYILLGTFECKIKQARVDKYVDTTIRLEAKRRRNTKTQSLTMIGGPDVMMRQFLCVINQDVRAEDIDYKITITPSDIRYDSKELMLLVKEVLVPNINRCIKEGKL